MRGYPTYHQSVVPFSLKTVVTRKGQITIPAPIREVLNIKEGDTIAVSLQEDAVTLTPITSMLAEGYQSIPPLSSRLSWKEIKRLALEDHAEEVVRQG